MPKAYWVVTYRSVSDPQKLAAYAKLAVAAARFLARGNPAVAFEHGLKERTVITEYPHREGDRFLQQSRLPRSFEGSRRRCCARGSDY